MAAGLSVDLDRWRREFDELMLRVGGRFARVEPRRVAAFVLGLLAGLPRLNCWSIAGHTGEEHPRGMQRLLSAAVWDEAGVRDDLRGLANKRRDFGHGEDHNFDYELTGLPMPRSAGTSATARITTGMT